MKRRTLIFIALIGTCLCAAVLYAQQQKGVQQTLSDRVDLETETWVGKRLEKTEAGSDGRTTYRFLYRVEARQRATDLPRYIVDHRYSVTYTTEGFQAGDTVTLLSANEETDTDSPIWIYEVTYVGSGERTVTFETSGSVMAPMFATVSGETECPACGCDLLNCGDHGFCDLCNPGCSLNGCPASCEGCSCLCHATPVCDDCGKDPCECDDIDPDTPEDEGDPPDYCPI